MVRQVGSHRRYQATYTDEAGAKHTVVTVVAQHTGDIPPGTLRAIEKQMQPAFGQGWLRKGK